MTLGETFSWLWGVQSVEEEVAKVFFIGLVLFCCGCCIWCLVQVAGARRRRREEADDGT